MCRTTLEYINFYRTHLDADIFLYKKFKCFTGTGQLLVSELVCDSLGCGNVIPVLVADSFGYCNDYVIECL